jgi:mannosylfructose-phosphate synthase
MKNILMLSIHGYVAAEPELGKPDTGGQVVYVLELANRFSRLGIKVDLVTRGFEDQPEFDIVNENFKVWRIPFGGDKFIRKEDMHEHLGKFVTNFMTRSRNKGIKYDIVYSHYWDAGWAGQKIAEEFDIPHIHTPHSLGWWKRHNMGQQMDEATMEKNYRFEERIKKEFFVFQMCNHVIATTDPQYDLLIEKYDVLSRRISVIPPGMDENRFSPVRLEDKRRLQKKLKFGTQDVLVVGRMAKNKGHDLLIQAMPTLLKLVPGAKLVAAIGSDDSKQDIKGVDELKKLAQELQIADKVTWRPYIPDDELADYYRAASIFSLASRYEPFGMVAIEAMACGTPAVVSVHGGLKDIIDFGNQALFADPNRPEEYGAMLAMPMLYDDLALEISVEGARFARRMFGWTGIAKRMIAIFDSFINVNTVQSDSMLQRHSINTF